MKRFETLDSVEVSGKKIAILLPNPCNPDYRVIKHAEYFARNGYEVRVYCRWTEGLPHEQVINDVTYIRRCITAKGFAFSIIKSFFSFNKKPAKPQSSDLMRS
jgi:hypothetical protein